jgi:hypothetical protein
MTTCPAERVSLKAESTYDATTWGWGFVDNGPSPITASNGNDPYARGIRRRYKHWIALVVHDDHKGARLNRAQ